MPTSWAVTQETSGRAAYFHSSQAKWSDRNEVRFDCRNCGDARYPAFAEEVGVGVGVGPVGAGATVGDGHRDYDRDRDHTTTVIKEREPTDRTTVIKKENEDGTRSKTVIHDRE
jgi:hypothetical protein